MRCTGIFLTIVASHVLAIPAAADWPAGGVLVSSPNAINLLRNAHILDLPGGDLAIVGVGSGGNSNYFNLQRVTRNGVLASGWPQDGVDFGFVIKGVDQTAQSFFADDQSRVWHSWMYGQAHIRSIASDGTAVPGLPQEQFDLGYGTSGVVAHSTAAPDGDAYVTCGSDRLKRITPAGATAAGWPSAGVALPGLAWDDNAVLGDGSGGAVVFMRLDPAASVPVATRIDDSGARHAGWPAGGLALSGTSQGPSPHLGDAQLLPSGPDHCLAVWSTDAGSGMRALRVQRFGLDASLDPAWPVNGLAVVAADTLVACRAIPDGSGGAYVLRQAHGHPVGTHVTAAGAILGGSDVDLLDASAQYLPTYVFGVHAWEWPDEIIADHTPDGGLLVGWNDTRLAPAVSFRLRWLTPSLTAAPGKPDTGLVYFPPSPHPYEGALLALHADGADAAFIAWGDYHDIGFGQVNGDVWMYHVQAPVVVGVEPVSSPAPGLVLSAPRPNPARDAVAFVLSLPDDSPARVELLDVVGRVVRTQSVQGRGPHAVTLSDLGDLAPGLYFARAAGRADARSVKLVLGH